MLWLCIIILTSHLPENVNYIGHCYLQQTSNISFLYTLSQILLDFNVFTININQLMLLKFPGYIFRETVYHVSFSLLFKILITS